MDKFNKIENSKLISSKPDGGFWASRVNAVNGWEKYCLDNEEYTTIRNIMRVMKETGMRYSSFDYLTVEGIKAGKIKCMIKRRI